DDHIALHQRAILLHICRESSTARLLIWIIASGIALLRIVCSHPQVISDEAAALPLWRPFMEEREGIASRHQLVSDWLSEAVERGRIDNLPVARRPWLNAAHSLALRLQRSFTGDPGIAAWIFRSPGQRLAIYLNH